MDKIIPVDEQELQGVKKVTKRAKVWSWAKRNIPNFIRWYLMYKGIK